MIYLIYNFVLSHNYNNTRMRLIKHCRYFMGRKSSKSDYDFNSLADAKFEYMKRYSQRFKSQEKFKHKEILYEEFVYGHSCHIVGTTAFNFASMGFAKSAMNMVNPRLLILGGMCDN